MLERKLSMRIDTMTWQTEWPTKEGQYWFYGYPVGKIHHGLKNKPELLFVNVYECADGVQYVSSSITLCKKQTVNAHFKKVVLPELPNME